MTDSKRFLTGVTVLILMLSAPVRMQHRQGPGTVDASVGFPFTILRETPSSIGPSAHFILVTVPQAYYSRENLERIWQYFCAKYPNKAQKLDLRVYVERGTLEGAQAVGNTGSQLPGWDANFLRQGDGAAAGGGDNELLIYRPDLNKSSEVKRVVLKGKDPFGPYAYTGEPNSDFVASAAKGDMATFESLLAAGVSVDARNRFRGTALIEASLSGETAMVERLLMKGADINARDENGWSALMGAASQGYDEIVRFLLEKGAEINAKNGIGMSALSRAIYDRKVSTFKLLLERGAEFEFRDQFGETPLIIAANRDPEVVKTLLEKGADPNIRTNKGESALMQAFQEESVIALLKKGVDINARDVDGNTALMYAVMKRNPNKIRILLNHSADVSLKNNNGETALTLTRHNRDLAEIAKILIDGGATK